MDIARPFTCFVFILYEDMFSSMLCSLHSQCADTWTLSCCFYRNIFMDFFRTMGRINTQLYFSCVIIYHSLVDASSVVRKQRFLRDASSSPLLEPLLVVSVENAFQCTYACALRVDCGFYSYDKPAKTCSLYVDQPGSPVVAKAKGTGHVFYKGNDILHLHL